MPAAIPGALRRRGRNRLDQIIVQLLERRNAEPAARLRNARLAASDTKRFDVARHQDDGSTFRRHQPFRQPDTEGRFAFAD